VSPGLAQPGDARRAMVETAAAITAHRVANRRRINGVLQWLAPITREAATWREG